MIPRLGLLLLVGALAGSRAMACSCAGVGLPGVFGTPTEEQLRDQARRAALFSASLRIEVRASLDRAEYYAGQIGELRVSFHNPTSERLEVWDPAVGASVFVDGSNCQCPWTPNITRWFGPGETVNQVFRMGSPFFNMPPEPGEHKVYFSGLAGNVVEPLPFRVLRPIPSFLSIRPIEPGQARKPGDGMFLLVSNLELGCPDPQVIVGGIVAWSGMTPDGVEIGAEIPKSVKRGDRVPVRLVCEGRTIGEIPVSIQ